MLGGSSFLLFWLAGISSCSRVARYFSRVLKCFVHLLALVMFEIFSLFYLWVVVFNPMGSLYPLTFSMRR